MSGWTPSSTSPDPGSTVKTRARYAALVPQLGCVGKLAGDRAHEVAGRDRRSLDRLPEPRLAPCTARGPGRCSARRGPPPNWPGCRACEALGGLPDRAREEHAGQRRHSPTTAVRTGQPARPPIEQPMSGRSRSGRTNPVAEITSSTSMASVAAAVGPAEVHGQAPSPPAVRSIRSSAASRTATPPPRTKSSYGWTYRARTPAREFVWTENLAGDGEASAI